MPAASPASDAPIAIVFNPVKIARARLEAMVERARQRHEIPAILWYETTVEEPGDGQTQRALAQGAGLVIAAGGDGTVRAVADALRGCAIPLGLLPVGTGNLLARNLRLPLLSLGQAFEVALTGHSHAIDVGMLRTVTEPEGDGERLEQGDRSSDSGRRADQLAVEHSFLVMAGLGLDAAMLANTNPVLKRRLGWLAYIDGGFRSMRNLKRIPLRYTLDAAPERTLRVHTLLVGNCGLLPANILLLPEAEIDDGVLDIVALRPEGFRGWVQVWVKVLWENGVLRRSQAGRKFMGPQKPVRTLRYLQGRRIAVTTEQPVSFQVDGEPLGSTREFLCWVEPAALLVRVAGD